MSNPVKSVRILILAFSLFFAHTTAVSALTMTNHATYTQSVTAIGSMYASMLLPITGLTTPFDPSLGTLEGVDITFTGQVISTITSGLSFYNDGLGGIIYAPYTIMPTFSIDIDGLNGFYEFATPATMLPQAFTVSGSGESIPLFSSYSFTFSYDDLLGQFIGPSGVYGALPPTMLYGGLTDFIDSATLLDYLTFIYELSFLEAGKVPVTPTIITATSILSIDTTYSYTPTPAQVPEPGTALLLVLGLFVMIGLRTARLTVKFS